MKNFATILASFVLLAATARATFSQGLINPARDHLIKFDQTKYANTEAFCRTFRSRCVSYVGALGYHHQLDCVFDQPGPSIRAWCGGLKKASDGTWDNNSTPKTFTTEVVPMVPGNNKIVGNPVTAVVPVKRKVKMPSTNFSAFRKQWKAACANYASALTKGRGYSLFRCVQLSTTTASVTCGSRLGNAETDVTDKVVKVLKLKSA